MRALFRTALAVALLAASAFASAEVQKRTLLASDGTLYQAATGLASDLGLTGFSAGDYAVVWNAAAQDGTLSGGSIPGAANGSPKTSLDLTFDEPTGTLVVLWREENSLVNKIRLAFGKSGAWTVADLLPNVGFPHAYNPQMLLTHQSVHSVDADDADVFTNRSVLSIVWWEEASAAQARYASFFLDETIDPSAVAIYDLPELVGDSGRTVLEGVPRGAYTFPALQAEGPGGAVLASFASLASGKENVVRLTYPTELGKPSADNSTWLRRRIPVVGVVSQGPIAGVPSMEAASVHTVVGSSYRPTLHWRDELALHYVRFDGAAWSDVKSIVFTPDLGYDQAVALVEEMARRN
jgi:hypothetical protein